MKTISLTRAQTFDLISKVREQRCLWDRTHADYRKHKHRVDAWETISQKMGFCADDLALKWQSLQSTYRRYKTQSRTHGIESVMWAYFSAMQSVESVKDDDESEALQSSDQEPNSHGEDGENSNSGKPVRRKLHPSGITRTKRMRGNRPFRDVVKVEAVSRSLHSPATSNSDDTDNKADQLENPFESFFMPEQVAELSPTQESRPVKAAVITEQDEDFFFVQSVAYLLKQFPPGVKRKLQIDIHDLIVTEQKREYEKQYGDTFQ